MIRAWQHHWYALLLCAAAVPAAGADLTGVWQRIDSTPVRTAAGGALPFTPAAQAEYLRRETATSSVPPAPASLARCIPGGPPELMYRTEPFQLLQTGAVVLFIHEANHLPRFVHMNATHPPELDPTHLGHSIGHWEGATLVIDTIGFHDKSQAGSLGLPQTEALHVVERLRLRQGGRVLEDQMQVEDTGAFEHSWQASVKYRRRPGARLKEQLCALQR